MVNQVNMFEILIKSLTHEFFSDTKNFGTIIFTRTKSLEEIYFCKGGAKIRGRIIENPHNISFLDIYKKNSYFFTPKLNENMIFSKYGYF